MLAHLQDDHDLRPRQPDRAQALAALLRQSHERVLTEGTITGCGRCCASLNGLPLADEPPLAVRVGGVPLVAVEALAVLLRPARLHILLHPLGITPVRWHLALLDRLVLLTGVALDRRVHNARIDDLAAAGDKTGLVQLNCNHRADVANLVL